MVLMVSRTFTKQKLYGAQVTLAGSHHEEGPALLVADVDISTVLQQQLCNLGNSQSENGHQTHAAA